jgi:hypothetical protein
VVANLLKQESGEPVADTGNLRLKADIGPGEQPGIISDSELHRTTDIVSRAADLVAELARRNRVIDANAREMIEAHKAEADAAQERAAELQVHADMLETRMDEMAAEFQGYVLDLQGKLTSCRADLDLRTREAQLSREWLVYLSSEIMDRLGDAPAKLNKLARETRSGLPTADPESRPPTLGENSLTSKDEKLQVSYDPDERTESGDQQRVVRVNRLRRRYAGIRTAGAVN